MSSVSTWGFRNENAVFSTAQAAGEIHVKHQKAAELTAQAHTSELGGNYRQAFDLHAQASRLLSEVLAGRKKQSEEWAMAKLQLQAANERQNVLRACAHGNGPPPELLPSLATADRDIENPLPGTVPLSLIQTGKSTTLSPTPGIPKQLPESPSDSPFLTPMLSPSLPTVTYHVYAEQKMPFTDKWVFLHVKNENKTQTLYTLVAFKATRVQIPVSMLTRAAEYHTTCAVVSITPIVPRDSKWDSRQVARPLKITTDAPTTVVDTPDRLEKKDWVPRRFTYGNRGFVWKDGDGITNDVDTLYEVEKVWTDPESKTGKKLDKTHTRPLMWGETKSANKKVCTIHMAGGLDQRFREFLLASQLTRQLIYHFGHGP